MSAPLPILMESAFQIAWDYLEQTDQIDDPEFAGWLLLDAIEHMIRCGERRRLALSNGAITTYERLMAERSNRQPSRWMRPCTSGHP
jgi:hypothetical protein